PLEAPAQVGEAQCARQLWRILRPRQVQLERALAAEDAVAPRQAGRQGLEVEAPLHVEGGRAPRPETRLALRRDPRLARLHPQPRELDEVAVAREREAGGVPLELLQLAREREVGRRVAQPRRLAQRQLQRDAAAARELG